MTAGMTREELARLFEEWMRRSQADPEQFAKDWLKSDPTTYGDAAAGYFLQLQAELQAAL